MRQMFLAKQLAGDFRARADLLERVSRGYSSRHEPPSLPRTDLLPSQQRALVSSDVRKQAASNQTPPWQTISKTVSRLEKILLRANAILTEKSLWRALLSTLKETDQEMLQISLTETIFRAGQS